VTEPAIPDPTPPPEEEWQRFHPLTPLLRGGVVFMAIVGYVISTQTDRLFGSDPEDPTQGHLGIAAALAGVVLLAVIAGSWVIWLAARFRMGRTTLELKHGLVMRQHRQVRYDRIQAVNITRPLLARLAGLSAVKVEAAGGAGSNIELAFLPQARAEDLRIDLMRRAAVASGTVPASAVPGPAADGDPAGGAASGPAAGAPPGGAGAAGGEAAAYPTPAGGLAPGERLVAAIPASRVWVATAMSFNTIFLVVTLPLLISALVLGHFSLVPVLGPMVLASLGQQVKRFTSWMNFRVEAGPDVVRIRHGLTELSTMSVPLHRIQAVEVSQPAMWRGLGWWRINVNVAGVHREPDAAEESIIPVGTHEEVFSILAAMGPTWSLPEVGEGMYGEGPSGVFVAAPERARRLDPLSWKRIGYAATPSVLLSRGGWLGRSVQIVPHARVQSLGLDQGMIERRLRLANVHLHSTNGSVTPVVRHLDVDAATRLLNEEAARARDARHAEAGEPAADPLGPKAPTDASGALSSLGEGTEGPRMDGWS